MYDDGPITRDVIEKTALFIKACQEKGQVVDGLGELADVFIEAIRRLEDKGRGPRRVSFAIRVVSEELLEEEEHAHVNLIDVGYLQSELIDSFWVKDIEKFQKNIKSALATLNIDGDALTHVTFVVGPSDGKIGVYLDGYLIGYATVGGANCIKNELFAAGTTFGAIDGFLVPKNGLILAKVND